MKDCDDPVGGLDGTPGKGGESGKVVNGRGTIAASEHVEVVSSTGGDIYPLQQFNVYLKPELVSATFPGGIVGVSGGPSSGGPIGSGSPGGSGGSVLPPIFITVANTEEYTSSANNYTPPSPYHINETGPGNAGEVNYAAFAEKMKADALALANNLTALKAQKAAAVGGGPDGPDCDIDVDYPANTFTIEVKSKFQVVPCEDPVPSEFTCSAFTVTGDGTEPITITDGTSTFSMNGSGQASLTNGTITITMNGGSLSISGATGTLDLGALNITTTGTVTGSTLTGSTDVVGGGKSLKTHRHNYEDAAANTSTTRTTTAPN